jgi:hypothetical protein
VTRRAFAMRSACPGVISGKPYVQSDCVR